MHIDRCYCFQQTFAALKSVAAQTKAGSVEELQRYVRFGLRCRLCLPYVRYMLQTGQTVFRAIIQDSTAL